MVAALSDILPASPHVKDTKMSSGSNAIPTLLAERCVAYNFPEVGKATKDELPIDFYRGDASSHTHSDLSAFAGFALAALNVCAAIVTNASSSTQAKGNAKRVTPGVIRVE